MLGESKPKLVVIAPVPLSNSNKFKTDTKSSTTEIVFWMLDATQVDGPRWPLSWSVPRGKWLG